MHEDMFNLVGLLYSNADADTVDAGFDKDFFVLVTGDSKRIEEHFR